MSVGRGAHRAALRGLDDYQLAAGKTVRLKKNNVGPDPVRTTARLVRQAVTVVGVSTALLDL